MYDVFQVLSEKDMSLYTHILKKLSEFYSSHTMGIKEFFHKDFETFYYRFGFKTLICINRFYYVSDNITSLESLSYSFKLDNKKYTMEIRETGARYFLDGSDSISTNEFRRAFNKHLRTILDSF